VKFSPFSHDFLHFREKWKLIFVSTLVNTHRDFVCSNRKYWPGDSNWTVDLNARRFAKRNCDKFFFYKYFWNITVENFAGRSVRPVIPVVVAVLVLILTSALPAQATILHTPRFKYNILQTGRSVARWYRTPWNDWSNIMSVIRFYILSKWIVEDGQRTMLCFYCVLLKIGLVPCLKGPVSIGF
jgi:hypothetical protein